MIDKRMTIGEVLTMDHGSAEIMTGYGMHCLGCPSALMESLEDASRAHGIEPDELVGALEAFFAARSGANKPE